MRLHTKLSPMHVINALSEEKEAGRIAHSVTLKTVTKHRSNTAPNGIEVQLEAWGPGQGRRLGNSGSYGAGEGYAATYDEWGWLLANLYGKDPEMVVGSPKSPTYAGKVDFMDKTGMSYHPRELIAAIENIGDPYPLVTGRGGNTRRGYLIGRRGYGRKAEGEIPSYWPHKYAPRTVAEVLEFARMSTKEAGK